MALVAGLCHLAPLAAAQAAPRPAEARTAYATPQILAPVSGGRKVHLVCQGQGSPTVVFTAGLGNWSEIWRKVQPAVAQTTRACAWDRAGFGYSSPSAERQDVGRTTADLERALASAHIRGPYVLVGHSMGGYESLLFADRHPRDVVGMVLVDPSFPDQARIIAGSAPLVSAMFDKMDARDISLVKMCAEKVARREWKPGDREMADCLDTDEAAYEPELVASLRPFERDPARFTTEASTLQEFARSSRLVANPRRTYGAMPLTVLTAGDPLSLPPLARDVPGGTAAFAKFLATTWREQHQALAALSVEGRHRVVEGSSHYIHVIKPGVVIEAIDEVVARARQKSRRREAGARR